MKELRLALLGYGNAGRAFGKLLMEKHKELISAYHTDVKVCAIATKSKGTLVKKEGIDLNEIEEELNTCRSFKSGISMSAMEVVKKAEYDVLLELTPLDIFSGQPAIDHIRGAFERGKHVISANKGPIAWAFDQLCAMAKERDCFFFYETTVMDGTPVFNLVADTLKMCKVTEINGILNTTTNFILEELAKGCTYDDAIAEGKRRGFVEADPSMDVLGWDAAAKITALLNVLMKAGITPMDIEREGIENITFEQIKNAAADGKEIKLVCNGKVKDGNVCGSVKPVELLKDDLLASVSGTSSVISITTDLMGTISIFEHDPEIEQTAYGVFSDLIRVLERLK